MIGFLLFVFGAAMLCVGFAYAKAKPAPTNTFLDKMKSDLWALETLTKRFGKEKATQIMKDRDYYAKRNKLIRSKGRRYRFDVKTGEWKLIFKGDPLFYE